MNSVLNPDAPEFFPHLTSLTQEGYTKLNRTIKSTNNLPVGSSLNIFKTYTDFNSVSYQLSENVVDQTNEIIYSEMSSVLKRNDNEYNTDKITDANDSMLDRVNINIDNVTGVNKPDEGFVKGIAPRTSWNKPIISKIQVGSAVFIGAKNIPRPQLSFKDTVDNSESLWVPKISDKPNNVKPLTLNILYNDEGEAVGYEHPYRVELDLYQPPSEFIDPDPEPPLFPASLEETSLTLVETEADLDKLVDHLTTVEEIAVDVEHHSYRTYQGITCLIQITTNEGGDFIIDTLAIREHIHKLNLIFTDPKKIKVFHGAESDVLWLQRDFGVYIVGLFDTHKAATMLNLQGLSLKYLLMKYCGVETDKSYQLADWRIRPLPHELVEYARTDTHYLLFIWRVMKHELLERNSGQPHLLLSVFEESRQICGTTYNKETIHEMSHFPLYLRSKKTFNSQQMAALKMLYQWRDTQARSLDESTTYLLPNHMMLTLAELLPREMQGVSAACDPMPPFVKQNLIAIHRMLLSCRELPLETQLFRFQSVQNSISYMNYMSEPLMAYFADIHDFGEYFDNLEGRFHSTKLKESVEIFQLNPDVQAFVPATKTEIQTHVVSQLNAEAKLFIPPFDRYKKYRTLAQLEEMRDMKEKQAKVAAISKGDKLINKEVLQKLQQAQTSIQQEDDGGDQKAGEDKADQKTAQRKRKISDKNETKPEQKPAEAPDQPKASVVTKAPKTSTVKSEPFDYQKANYKKFFDDTNKPKQGKANQKKYKMNDFNK